MFLVMSMFDDFDRFDIIQWAERAGEFHVEDIRGFFQPVSRFLPK